MSITITPLAPAGGPSLLAPAIGWDGFTGDFVADPVTGLATGDAIRSAILMLLESDVACAPEELRFEHGGDRRGWAGDGFGIDAARGEQPLGSTLWLLRRTVLNADVVRRAEAEAIRALQPLVRQRLAESVSARGEIAGVGDQLHLFIDLKRRDGRPVFSDRFDLLWRAAA